MNDWRGYSGKSGTDPGTSGLLDMVLNPEDLDITSAMYFFQR